MLSISSWWSGAEQRRDTPACTWVTQDTRASFLLAWQANLLQSRVEGEATHPDELELRVSL
eukprot:5258172-Prymnesium_polylepis.1